MIVSEQDLCKKMHQKIDVIDEERYDLGSKVGKSDKEVGLYLICNDKEVGLYLI